MWSVTPPPLEQALAHAQFLRAVARGVLGGDAEVEDFRQETFVVALLALPEASRTTLLWRCYADRPVAEIAELLDGPIDRVRTRIQRALVRRAAWCCGFPSRGIRASLTAHTKRSSRSFAGRRTVSRSR